MPAPTKGRPTFLDHSIISDLVLKYKNIIYLPNGKIVSKLDKIWEQIWNEMSKNQPVLQNKLSKPKSLYSYVSDNRHGIRDKLRTSMSNHIVDADAVLKTHESLSEDSTIASENDNTNYSDASMDARAMDVLKKTFSIEKTKFLKFVREKQVPRNDKRKKSFKYVKQLVPGEWEDFVTEKLWCETKLSCGFQFKNHYLSYDQTHGSIKGYCKCGTDLFIRLESNENCVKFHCTIKLGRLKQCGKRYLRQPKRGEVGKDLEKVSAERYQSVKADELISPGDPIPPHLPSLNVLHVAKNEYIGSTYLDKDPIIALGKLKRQNANSGIQHISYDPFFVLYSTNFQKNVFRCYAREENACLIIDASGRQAKKIVKVDGSTSGHIFVYLGVIRCRVGQFSVTQMISESHDMGTILYWLNQWIRSGVPAPVETVCDYSRALLIALVRAFTGYLSIENYADSFLETGALPKCYIRIDVAHFIKIYANFLKESPRLVKKFFLGAIGKLILSRNLISARSIIKSLLVVCLSETNGFQIENITQKTSTQIHEESLQKMITSNSDMNNIIDDTVSEDTFAEFLEDTVEHDDTVNSWSTWGAEIKKEALEEHQPGTVANAYYSKNFAEKLLKDVKHLPLWSCVYRDKFGYGRVPASSAPVEGEFNKMKNVIFNTGTKLRVDKLVEEHVSYLNGRMKIAQAHLDKGHNETETSDNGTEACNRDMEASFNGTEASYHENNDNSEVFTSDNCNSILTTKTKSNRSNLKECITSSQNNCTLCEKGEKPTGAHKCVSCNKFVHIIFNCSFSLPNTAEGYGEKRLCSKCYHLDKSAQIIAVNETENWGGLGQSKKQRKARYLRNEDELLDAFKFPQHQKIPIIKNGSLTKLNAVRIASKSFTLQSTCALDSLIQIILLTLSKHEDLRTKISEFDHKFFNLINDLLDKGLRSYTYTLRVMLYLEIFNNDKENYRFLDVGDSTLIDCNATIAHITRLVMRNYPSYTETSQCTAGCEPRNKNITIIPIEYAELCSPNLDTILYGKTSIEDSICYQSPICTNIEKTTFVSAGIFIFFEIIDVETLGGAKLGTLKKTIKFRDESYNLIGIVNYKIPMTTRRSDCFRPETGHYTAICPRSYNKWVEYDDQKSTECARNNTEKVNPSLIVYGKVTML